MNKRIAWLCVPLLAGALLAGCGGGGGGDGGSYFPPPPTAGTPPPATNPPPMASAYDSFVAYVKGLVQTALDTAEPADVAAFDPPPTSDTLEPVSTQ